MLVMPPNKSFTCTYIFHYTRNNFCSFTRVTWTAYSVYIFWIWPYSECSIFRLRCGYAGIIQVLGVFFGHLYDTYCTAEYVSYFYDRILRQFETHRLLPVYGQLCTLYTIQLSFSEYGQRPEYFLHVNIVIVIISCTKSF